MASVGMEEPRKPQNAYWMWLSDSRAAILKEVGDGSVTAVGKAAGEKWKAMSAAEKAPYEKKAADAKKAFEQALEEFKAQGGVAGSRRKEKADAKKDLLDKRAKKRARQERNADKPKRPQTAFWLWLGENRAALANEAGSGSGPAVGKLGSERWKSLDAKLKAPFEKQAAEKKAEYDKALKEYKEKKGITADDDEAEEEDDDGDKENEQ